MDRRPELRDKLYEICPNLYFQPPESVKLTYPCVIYSRVSGKSKYADNNLYSYKQAYRILVVDRNPDSELIQKIMYEFPMCSYDNHFVKDNLNHDILTLYY